MKIWILKIGVLLSAGVVYLVGQYFRGNWWPNFTWPYQCNKVVFGNTSYCDPVFMESLGFPLIAAGQILAIAGLILLFANKEGLRKWLWMSAVYLSLGAIIVLNIPTESHAWAISLTPSREHATWLLGYLYILTTLVIVAYTRYAARKKPLSAQ